MLCFRAHAQSLENVVETVLPIDHEFIESLPVPEARPHSGVNSHNAAYIIPTSGTTGQPKLTLLEHGNFCTSLKGFVPGLLLDATTPLRALQFAAHSFDASIIEYLAPLMIGGTVCIPDEETRLNDIAKAINDMRITWTELTPTFVRFLEPSMVPTLRNICLVGEAMSQANLDTWSQINLANGYVALLCRCILSTDNHPATDQASVQSPRC